MYARAAIRAIAIEARGVCHETVRTYRENTPERERPIPRAASHLRTSRHGPKSRVARSFRSVRIGPGCRGLQFRGKTQFKRSKDGPLACRPAALSVGQKIPTLGVGACQDRGTWRCDCTVSG